jgi:hypothetical protein
MKDWLILAVIIGGKLTGYLLAAYLLIFYGAKGGQKELDRVKRLYEWKLKTGKGGP